MNVPHPNEMVQRQRFEKEKQFKLILALGIDFLGMLSYLLPGWAEISDAIMAPFSAIMVYIFFKRKLKWAAFTFLEELMPFTDAIPSASLAWYSIYVKNEAETIKTFLSEEEAKDRLFKEK